MRGAHWNRTRNRIRFLRPLQLPLPLLVDGMHSEQERPRLSPLQHPPRKVACSVVCLSLLPPLRRLSLRSLQWNQSPQLAR